MYVGSCVCEFLLKILLKYPTVYLIIAKENGVQVHVVHEKWMTRKDFYECNECEWPAVQKQHGKRTEFPLAQTRATSNVLNDSLWYEHLNLYMFDWTGLKLKNSIVYSDITVKINEKSKQTIDFVTSVFAHSSMLGVRLISTNHSPRESLGSNPGHSAGRRGWWQLHSEWINRHFTPI